MDKIKVQFLWVLNKILIKILYIKLNFYIFPATSPSTDCPAVRSYSEGVGRGDVVLPFLFGSPSDQAFLEGKVEAAYFNLLLLS